MKDYILVEKGYLLLTEQGNEDSKYYAAQLLNRFGVLVDKPNLITKHHVELISAFFGINVPAGFYKNPQDTKYFTCDELLIEQLVSYFSIDFIEGVKSNDDSSFDRIAIFKKILPTYKDGDEVVFRNYKVISEEQSNIILVELVKNLGAYTRKWGIDESRNFEWLYRNGYASGVVLSSKDNILDMLVITKDKSFAKLLNQKDVVKLSVSWIGEVPSLKFDKDQVFILRMLVQNCKKIILTKKQAKYYNSLNKYLSCKKTKENNSQSPYRLAKLLLNDGNVVGAARIFAQNGSLLERNLTWLLSRSNEQQCLEIIDLLPLKNPIIILQFLSNLFLEDSSEPRTFRFYNNRKLRHHIETSDEHRWRKSVLNQKTKDLLQVYLMSKIQDYYKSLPSLGNIYISEVFKKIAIPFNTSASGSGLGVLPLGSRLPITDNYIRTFCYWDNVFDIDSSVTFINTHGDREALYWGNYAQKYFGESALTSGDDRGFNGSEYIDFKISELLEKGYLYGIYGLNGYGDTLNEGDIFCGYQNKKDLDTRVWSPKNIALKVQVKGNSRGYMGFAIDLKQREIVILNQMLANSGRVISVKDSKSVEYYLQPTYLQTLNMATIISCRGNVVSDPTLADVVFDDSYIPVNKQKIVKTTDIEKFVSLLK